METKSVIYFNTRDELVRVDLRHVVFFKSDKNYTEIYFINGQSVIVSYPIGSVAEMLSNEQIREKAGAFIRLGRSVIINPKYLFKINTLKQELILGEMSQKQMYKLQLPKETLRKFKEMYRR